MKNYQTKEIPCRVCGAPLIRSINVTSSICFKHKTEERRARSRGELKQNPFKKVKKAVKKIFKKKPEKKIKIDRISRDKVILEQYLDATKTGQELADEYGISRQRVDQIVRKLLVESGIPKEKIQFKKGRRDHHLVETTCGYKKCGAPISFPSNKFKGHGKHFCCSQHRADSISKYWNPDGTKMTPQEKARYLYHNDPKRRAAITKANKKWRDANWTEERKEKVRQYSRRYYAKKKLKQQQNNSVDKTPDKP